MDEVDKYLRLYYSSFSDFLKELGSDPEKVLPFEIFMEHWKRYRRYGLALGLFGFRFMLSEDDETVTLKKDEYAAGFLREMANQEEQDRRVTDVVKHFVENGVLL